MAANVASSISHCSPHLLPRYFPRPSVTPPSLLGVEPHARVGQFAARLISPTACVERCTVHERARFPTPRTTLRANCFRSRSTHMLYIPPQSTLKMKNGGQGSPLEEQNTRCILKKNSSFYYVGGKRSTANYVDRTPNTAA